MTRATSSVAERWAILFVAVLLSGAACGRSRKENVPVGEARVVKAPEAVAAAGDGTSTEAVPVRAPDAPPVSAAELMRRAAAKKIVERYRKATTPEDRAELLENLGQLGADATDALPLIDAACEDPSPLVRGFAVKARAGAGGPEALKRVRAALKDADEEVRVAGAEATSLLEGAASLATTLTALDSERAARVQEALLAAAERADSDEAVAGLVAMFVKAQTSAGVSIAAKAMKPALRSFAKRPDSAKAAAEPLAAYLNREGVDAKAVVGVLRLLDVRTVSVKLALVGALNDQEPALRENAFELLRVWAGRDFAYRPHFQISDNREAVLAFRTWAEGP